MDTGQVDDFDDFKAHILMASKGQDVDGLGIYEGGLGAYEVWWEANSRYPMLALSQRLAVAENVVRSLLEEGAVTLVRVPSDPNRSRPATAVPDPVSALREDATWNPHGHDVVVWLAPVDH